MSWQKCPVCNGTGRNYNGLPVASTAPFCLTCNGHGIISELTGKPPAYEIRRGLTSNVNQGGVCNYFTPSSAHSSATICKQCGMEKWLHPTYVSDIKSKLGTTDGCKNSSVVVTSIDKCVMCGEDSIYPPNTDISLRMGYVEGAGQLCQSCYKS